MRRHSILGSEVDTVISYYWLGYSAGPRVNTGKGRAWLQLTDVCLPLLSLSYHQNRSSYSTVLVPPIRSNPLHGFFTGESLARA